MLTITYHEENPGEYPNIHLDGVEREKLYEMLAPLEQRVARDIEESLARGDE